MKGKGLWWKIPVALVGATTGIVLLLLIVVASVLYIPSLRTTVLEKGIAIANEKTDYDIDLGDIYLSPLHHSPLVFYRAYKGKEDLPLEVRIDSLFVGHRGQDTLAHIHALRLRAQVKTSHIVVDTLRLENVTFHSDPLIPTVGVDVVLDLLAVSSPDIIIAQGQYPLHGLIINNADVGIDLRSTPRDTTKTKTEPKPLRLCFDLPDGKLRNIHYSMTPLGLDIRTASIATNALIDVGHNIYDAKRIDIGGFAFGLNKIHIPADTIYGTAHVDLATNSIISNGLHVRSDELGAKADIHTTEMDLATMRIDATVDAEFQGSKAYVQAGYDIDDEIYDAHVDIERVDISPFVPELAPLIIAGSVDAQGQGFNPSASTMTSEVHLNLTEAIYNNINVSGIKLNAELANKTVSGELHLPIHIADSSMRINALTEHRFTVSDFMTPDRMVIDYHNQSRDIKANISGEKIKADFLRVDFATDSLTALDVTTQGMDIAARSPMHVLKLVYKIQPLLNAVSDSAMIHSLTSLSDLTVLDTIRRLIPDLNLSVQMRHGSPVQSIIDKTGLDIENVQLTIKSDSRQTDLNIDAATPNINPKDSTALHLPAIKASLGLTMKEGQSKASLAANTQLKENITEEADLRSDIALRMDIERNKQELKGTGRLTMDSVSYGDKQLGNHAIDMQINPSPNHPHALRADIQLDDIPLEVVESFINLKDIDIHGAIRAKASVDGLPAKTDISAEVLPIDIAAMYKPYQVGIGLGNIPVIMNHNHLDLNGLPIYGADSTFIALTGGLDLDSMKMDIRIDADSFAPVKLPEGGPIPVHGDLATDIRGRVHGALDSIIADVEVTLLPTTDITYPIDKKNLAQVKPHGTVRVHCPVSNIDSLSLKGRINVDDGFVKYSPKAYPIMPFHVDSGSHVAFNGPIGKTLINVSASQKVKADVESEDEDTRRVDFVTGVRVNGEVDSIGIQSIGFFLEAPDDEVVTEELNSLDEETQEGLAATLLATGMYVGESNVAAKRDGYALSSIVNSRINAALANSKVGKVVDIDLSSGQSSHNAGTTTNDMNISISKSFFKDRLRLTVGSTLTDNPEVNDAKGVYTNFNGDLKLTKNGNVLLRLYSKRDYNNVLEGELYKSGLSVIATKEWKRKQTYKGDSINRTYGLSSDAGVAYRSNNSIGPDVTIKSTIKNLFGKGEQFTLKGNGSYFWALRNRHPGDPKKTDTYKLGMNAALVFPYLHWAGENNPEGDTRYMLGYQYENIAGGYGVHKMSGALTYFFHSENSPYITHAFTPFSLSVVLMKAESDSLYSKAADFPELIKVIAGDEFIPSIAYNFYYDNYRSKRAVNTYLNLGVKESGNIINALYCLFGSKWNDKDKKLGNITFNQFVKIHAELRNKFNFTGKIALATRLYAGTNIPLGNSYFSPLSEAFYTGGPNSLRAASPYAYGPGNFYSPKYNQNFFHAGDVKLEANVEFRFPIVWKLFGAAFVDAGNVWNWHSAVDYYKAMGLDNFKEKMEIKYDLYDGILNNPEFAKQIALGTGAGLRLDIEGIVVRLDFGIGIHAPYQTYKYDKKGNINYDAPINSYYNIPSFLDGFRVNFGIGYPF